MTVVRIGLSYEDDDNIIGRFSEVLRLTTECKPVFKADGNLDFNMGKTMILTKDLVMSMNGSNISYRMTPRTLRILCLTTWRNLNLPLMVSFSFRW